MRGATKMLLVDTNVLAYLLIEGDQTRNAQALFALDGQWCSEGFVLVEFSNMLATYTRTGALRAQQGIGLLGEARALLSTVHNVRHEVALDTAMEFNISAYDARFVATAIEMRTKLITEDARLRHAAPTWTMSISIALH